MTEGALFAGIMGFGLGFHRAGFENLWAIEKEPFCQAVIRTHFPGTELFSDVKECGKHNLRPVDVITAGFPCQDLSVAGKRAGLEGARSGLFWEVVRILGELRPSWFVIENVPGLFSSSDGRDFAIVLQSLDELRYGLAWRVFDSQFFGVAQRRRRVFIVGRFGEPCPEEILFEPEGGQGDIAESGEERQDIASETGNGTASFKRRGGFGWSEASDISPTLESTGGTHQGGSELTPLVAGPLGGSSRSGGFQPNAEQAAEGHLQLVNCLAPVGGGADDNDAHAGHIVIQDARGQRDKKQNGIGIQSGGPSYTLDGTSEHAVAYALRQDPGGIGQGHNTTFAIACGGARERELASTLTSNEGPNRHGQGAPSNTQFDAVISTPPDAHGMRDFTGLPQGLDSARYRALGNAVTVQVAEWIAKRILEYEREIR